MLEPKTENSSIEEIVKVKTKIEHVVIDEYVKTRNTGLT